MAAWNCIRNIIQKSPGVREIVPCLKTLSIACVQARHFSSINALLKDCKYTTDHEWIATEDGIGTIGITNYAQAPGWINSVNEDKDKLGDVVYVDVPEVDADFSAGDMFGALESVKAASDLFTPVTGTVMETNENLTDSPGLINSSPYEEGWIVKMKLSNPEELESLMDEKDYDKFVRELETE